MLRVIKNDYTNNELNKIAKIIQMHFRYNTSKMYRKAFHFVNSSPSLTVDKKIKLLSVLDSSIDPSNKVYDPAPIDKMLREAGVYTDTWEYKYTLHLASYRVPGVKTIRNELEGLLAEYGGFFFSPAKNILTAEVGPFIIQGFNFGKFQIDLDLKYGCILGHEHIPVVNAVDPKYPSGDTDHTHPHVRGRQPCLGAGRAPLTKALSQGRILDSFSIVSSVLNTYSNDPFMKMEAWIGVKCRECGGFYDPKTETSECTRCGRHYCSSCVITCCDFSGSMCFRCKPSNFACDYCGARMCAECVEVCDKCKRKHCTRDVSEGMHRCV